MTEAGWAMLERLVPLLTWIHVFAHPLPGVALMALVAAVVGGLLVATVAVAAELRRIPPQRSTPRTSRRPGVTAAWGRHRARRTPARVGGAGPRAPGAGCARPA